MIEDYNVYEFDHKERIKFIFALAGFVSVVSLIFYGTVLGIILCPLLYKKGKQVYGNYCIGVRKNRLLLQFRDFLYSLSASFSAGRHMREAMEEAQVNLIEIYGKDSEMTQEICYMLRRMEETGETDIKVLEHFSKRSRLEDIRDFTEVFRACRESGGEFITAINRGAAIIGEKITVEREIKMIVAQKKLEGYIITAMPAVIIIFLRIFSADYLSVMYLTLAGRLLMTLALLAIGFAYIMIERITSIEI